MRRLRLVTATTVALALVAAGCSSGAPRSDGRSPSTTASARGLVRFPSDAQLAASRVPRAAPSPTDVPALVKGNTAFAFALYHQLAREGGAGGNLVFSPASISNALAMLEGGARGETLRQLDATLRFSLPEARLHDAFNALDQMLAAPRHAEAGVKGAPLKLEQTDAVWGQRGHPFVRAYLDLLARDYGAGLRLADFVKDAEAERVRINTYVANATHGQVKELFPRGIIDLYTRIVLVNAISFKGDWISPFQHEKTAAANFTRVDGRTVTVAMMHEGHANRSLDAADYHAIELAYVGGASMLIAEPAAGHFADVEHRVGPALFADFDRRSQRAFGLKVSMPKFTFASQLDLNQTLMAMGMRDAFTDSADLSGIDGLHDLYVKAVVHQATITVDEKGTEAAAATGAVGELMMASPSITIDHPFLFAIRDNRTGAILFAGRVMDPRAW